MSTVAGIAKSPGGQAPGATQLDRFREHLSRVAQPLPTTAEDLHRWSVDHYRVFWRGFLDWAGLSWEGSAETICTSDDVERARFFPDVRLNYAENLLRSLPSAGDDAPALTSVHGDGSTERLTRAELRGRVAATAAGLARCGVRTGDRVTVIAPNNARAAVTVLALAALGAAASTGMPDMGPTALLGRFEQVEPTALVLDRTGAATGWDGADGDILGTLLAGLPTLRSVLFVDELPLPDLTGRPELAVGRLATDGEAGMPPLDWPRLPFDHPLLVMFSSGTTGPPKAMVHGAGGTLLEHVKEHCLHGDLGPRDTLYFHTTTAWMMWNWQLSALAVGAHIVLYDGPVSGPETLWELVAEHGATVFGTSPAYLQLCEDARYRPADHVDLSRLRSVLSTGAVLHDWQFDWVARSVGPVPVQSISGGTDLVGCFVLGSPELPVQPGRCQTRSLGLDVAAVDESGAELVGSVGDLVCRNPFPSRPVHFLRDPDGRRFHDAYFAEHPGVWTHGDLIEIAADGSARLHGRSDGVLNVDGIRIGPSEIYTIVRGLPEIADAMAVEQRDPDQPGASRLVLLVVLRAGVDLDGQLAARIRNSLRTQASAAHVPSVVLSVPALPVTHNGKGSERAARDTLNGDPVPNLGALKNPECLAAIAERLHEQTRLEGDGFAEHVGDDGVAATVERLWWEILGAPVEGGHTFADLGGTSRQAMVLLRRVRTTVGRDVSIDQFLRAPTLSGLVAAVRGTERSSDAATVVPMAPGEPGLPPLFFLQDAWGDVDVYYPAAHLLTGTGPVLGIREKLEEPDGTPRTIEQIAAAAAADIDRAAPEGPVRLAGFSFGGLVAYEAARALVARGRIVDFLGLLDVLPPVAALTKAERLANGVATRVALLVPRMADESLREILTARFRPASASADTRLFLRSASIYHRYKLRELTVPVTYFRARVRIPVLHHVLWAWRRVARLTVVDAPGAHHDLMSAEHLAETMASLSKALAAAGPPIPPPSARCR